MKMPVAPPSAANSGYTTYDIQVLRANVNPSPALFAALPFAPLSANTFSPYRTGICVSFLCLQFHPACVPHDSTPRQPTMRSAAKTKFAKGRDFT
jgi:hypothetical protein